MNTKLTLNIDKSIIEQAKMYSKRNDLSLSKLVENYLAALTNKSANKERHVSALVESITGVISDKNIDERRAYGNYLSQKYK